MLFGYGRCSTDKQDVEVQIEQLTALGVDTDRIYIDRGFSGTRRDNRAGLDQALAAVWDGTIPVDDHQRPARMNWRAIAGPLPRLEPVTTTDFPFIPNSSCISPPLLSRDDGPPQRGQPSPVAPLFSTSLHRATGKPSQNRR